MIKVQFKVKSLIDQIDIVKSFLSCKNEMSYIVAKAFNLNLDALFELDEETKIKVITNSVSAVYNKYLTIMQKKCDVFQNAWNKKQNYINKEIFKIFGREYNFECVAYINVNPIWPRYIEDTSFDVNFNAAQGYLIMSCVHEILHFVWFKVWRDNFKDFNLEEFEYPNIVWLCSEIAIEPLFRFSKLAIFVKANPAYDYFYTEKIKGKTIAEIANELYLDSENIKDFQQKLFKFFSKKCNNKNLIK